ncbi:hypothetical protein FTO74_12655 [Granulicella sp. WH15]|uniref:hypothetical protein n=1 Tax=Granulicella sp. WH15 TaxID=2602070 RepID=UPI0013674C3F|nr:hypothetical protein [Granulicella sp. WH15]QHN04125.1 hypothetical protein FTO74_12655 [Granulicella sp. WH15]
MTPRIHPLTASDLMALWEHGSTLDDASRAVLLLSHGEGIAPDDAFRLDIGRRDQMLLELRSATFGSRLETYLECDGCGEAMEFAMEARQFQVTRREAANTTSLGSWQVRLPDSRDLRAASGCESTEAAERTLFLRCVTDGEGNAAEASPDNLEAFSRWMEEVSPEMELLVEMDCPACGRHRAVAFDVASFFWREIESACSRLVREVDALARVYGWSEREILDMSVARRRLYIEAVTA